MGKRLATRKNIFIPENTTFSTKTMDAEDKEYVAEIEIAPGHHVYIMMHEETFRQLKLMNPKPAFW